MKPTPKLNPVFPLRVVSMPLPEVSLPLPKVRAPKQARELRQVRAPNPNPPAIVLLPSLAVSHFAHPNPFAALQSESSDSEDEDEDDPPSFLRDNAALSITTPQAFIFSILSSVSMSRLAPTSPPCGSSSIALRGACLAYLPLYALPGFPSHSGLRMHRHPGPTV